MQNNSSTEQANLTIHNIFLKDLSYEAPATPQVFTLPWEPQVKFDIQVMRRLIEEKTNLHEVMLHLTVTTKLKLPSNVNNSNLNSSNSSQAPKNSAVQEELAFLIDLKLAGMFTVTGIQEPQLDRVLSTTAPTILFPYAAENIASLVIRGGFPQFILPPIDFTSLYQQRLEHEMQAKVNTTAGSTDEKIIN